MMMFEQLDGQWLKVDELIFGEKFAKWKVILYLIYHIKSNRHSLIYCIYA